MSSKRMSLALTTVAFCACGLAVACSSSNNNNGGSSNSNSNSASNSKSSSNSTGASNSGSNSSSGGTDGGGGTAGCGSATAPCIDNQSAATGSSISLKVPAGDAPGTWFTYGSDSGSQTSPGANGQAISPKQYAAYTFMTLATPAMPAGGPTITTAACLSSSAGFDGYSVGEGFHFVTKGGNPDAGVQAQPAPYDVSSYTGVTFWAMATQTSGTFHLRVKFPNAQTDGDAFAAPGNTYGNPPSACFGGDASSNSACFDDFSDDIATITSTWAPVTIAFATDLGQHQFGEQFASGVDLTTVYGIEFEVEGLGAPGGDAGLAPGFSFCIADIAFTK